MHALKFLIGLRSSNSNAPVTLSRAASSGRS